MILLYFILATFLIWAAIRVVTPSLSVELDFDTAHATFFIVYQHMARSIWAIFWTGIVGGVAYQHFVGTGFAGEVLVAGGVYALLLNAWLLTTYERYLHGRYPRSGMLGLSNYTAGKYALTLSLAICTVGTFVAGLVLALQGMGAR